MFCGPYVVVSKHHKWPPGTRGFLVGQKTVQHVLHTSDPDALLNTFSVLLTWSCFLCCLPKSWSPWEALLGSTLPEAPASPSSLSCLCSPTPTWLHVERVLKREREGQAERMREVRSRAGWSHPTGQRQCFWWMPAREEALFRSDQSAET